MAIHRAEVGEGGNAELSLRLWGRLPPPAGVPDPLAPPLAPAQLRALSPQALAYVGDAVYELFVRGCYLYPPRAIQTFHQQVVGQVRAEQQAAALAQLEPHLTPAEAAICKWGRNAAPGGRRGSAAVYGQATAFETLLGYLYLSTPERLVDLLGYLTPQADLSPP